jgi:membrane protein YqaA with SNARE-associated domain
MPDETTPPSNGNGSIIKYFLTQMLNLQRDQITAMEEHNSEDRSIHETILTKFDSFENTMNRFVKWFMVMIIVLVAFILLFAGIDVFTHLSEVLGLFK